MKRSYDGIVANAALRKAALVVGSYQVGDILSYCREARAGDMVCNGASVRDLIGFEKDRNSLGEAQPRTCLVICDSVPFCVAVDRLRPCTSAELLAFHNTQTKSSSPLATDAQTQQGVIDERVPIKPTVADSSRNANEGEDEDEQDDEMS